MYEDYCETVRIAIINLTKHYMNLTSKNEAFLEKNLDKTQTNNSSQTNMLLGK